MPPISVSFQHPEQKRIIEHGSEKQNKSLPLCLSISFSTLKLSGEFGQIPAVMLETTEEIRKLMWK
jgi:hypothetical protein